MLTRGVRPVVDGADGRGPSATAKGRLGGVGLLAAAALHYDNADVLLEQDVDQVRDEVVRLQSLQLRKKQSGADALWKRLRELKPLSRNLLRHSSHHRSSYLTCISWVKAAGLR